MELFILWCGFIGSWLLVAGPIYQAALELRDEDIERERIQAASATIQAPPKVSLWWWLLPPVKIILERRRSKAYKHDYVAALTPQDFEALVSFINKATAWIFVATGALLIASKEAYELAEGYHLNEFLVVPVAVFIVAVSSILNTIVRLKRSARAISKKQAT